MCKKVTLVIMLVLGLCVALAGTSTAQAPNTILYQGRLTTAAGAALSSDTATVLFAIYAAASGGTALWSASYPCSTDVNGVFTKELGPIALSVFDGSKRYLGLKVRADAEMTPRQILTSAPYSYQTMDVPGVAWGYSGNTVTLATSDIALDSAIITVPGPGYIVIIASLTFRPQHTSGTRDIGRFSISLNSKILAYSYSSMFTIPAAEVTDIDHPMPMALNRTDIAGAAGTYRYYFVGNMYSGAAQVTNFNITAMYFPASYGTTGRAPEAPPEGFIPDPNRTDGGLSKAASQEH